MSGELLSAAERQVLLKRHKQERDRRVADRIKAVILRDDGWSYEAIAEALLLSHEAIRQHLKDYEDSGKLQPENGGSESLLTHVQIDELLLHLDTHLYSKASDIAAYVHRTYGIRYSVRGMRDLITRHGFTFHQPCGVPAKADAKAQEAFVANYETIKATLGDNDHIVFMDGVHPSHAVRFVRGWIRKGQRREIPTNASQKRLNILGALNLETMTLQQKAYETLNAEATIDFLNSLLTTLPTGTINVILDRGRYQYCQAVWDFAEQNPRLRLQYLPPYSPNLNTIECLWKLMHEHTTNNCYHSSFKQFTEAIHHFFNVIFPQNARKWTDRLTDNFRIVGSSLSA